MKKLGYLAPLALAATVFLLAPARTIASDAKPAQAKLVLTKGMDADTVIKAYGKPDEILPMKDAGIPAEQWRYRRIAKQQVTQTASKVSMISTFAGVAGGSGASRMAEVPNLEYRTKHITIYQVTAMLMVEGKLQVASQWLEREESFDN